VPQRWQPFLHDLVPMVAAPTQVWSGRSGQISAAENPAEGVLHGDLRILSRVQVEVDGRPGEHIATRLDGRTTTFTTVLRHVGAGQGADPRIRLDRTRSVEPGAVSERLVFSSRTKVAVQLGVEVRFASHYAPMALIKVGGTGLPQPFGAEPDGDELSWANGGLAARLCCPGARLALPIEGSELTAHWRVLLPAGGRLAVGWRLDVTDAEADFICADAPLLAEALPVLTDARLRPWLDQSTADLNSLAMATPEHPRDVFLGAGAPWYLTLFGRDSIWAARMLVPVGLADGDVEALLPHLERALDWVVSHTDAEGAAFLTYDGGTGQGLANHGWKDSADSVRFADGRIATGSVALCEVQGYAYEAAIGGAAVLEAFGRTGTAGYRAWAAELATRFRRDFWCGEGPDRYPALAVDGDRRRVDSLTSNIGHLLGTGLLAPEEERLVAVRVTSPALDSGLGLRTMASTDAGYAPLSYHCGSVWPHDTAIVIAGLIRAGLGAYAWGLRDGLVRAAAAFAGRLPELFSGERVVVPYPASCRPQAWSAAAAFVVAYAVLPGERAAGTSDPVTGPADTEGTRSSAAPDPAGRIHRP
jgi:hypothetical protein